MTQVICAAINFVLLFVLELVALPENFLWFEPKKGSFASFLLYGREQMNCSVFEPLCSAD
jgi:hypothetical protein